MLPALLLSSAILGADVRHFAGSSLLPVVAAAATAAAEDAGGADDHNCASTSRLFFPSLRDVTYFPMLFILTPSFPCC